MFWKNIFYKSICVLFSDYSAVINGTVENGLIVSLFELYHVYVCRKVDIQLYNISMINKYLVYKSKIIIRGIGQINQYLPMSEFWLVDNNKTSSLLNINSLYNYILFIILLSIYIFYYQLDRIIKFLIHISNIGKLSQHNKQFKIPYKRFFISTWTYYTPRKKGKV
jgi:hypothetical protein